MNVNKLNGGVCRSNLLLLQLINCSQILTFVCDNYITKIVRDYFFFRFTEKKPNLKFCVQTSTKEFIIELENFPTFCDVKKRHYLGSVGRVPAKVNKKNGSGGWFRRLPARSPKCISFSLMVFTLKWLIFPINQGLKWCL